MLCIEGDYTYMGAVVRYAIYVDSEDLCNNIKQTYIKDHENALNMLKSSGGCVIKSENPLRIVIKDRSMEVVLEPKNMIAKMFWSEAIRRVRDYCMPGSS